MLTSIRTKLLVSHFALVLLGAFAFGATGYLLLQRQIEAAETEKLRVIASLVAEEIDVFFQTQQQTLIRIAEGREVQEFPTHYRVLALTSYLAKFKSSFPALSYWNAEGEIEVAVRNGDENPHPEEEYGPALQRLARQHPGEVFIGRVFESQTSPGLRVPLALGIQEYFGDKFTGVLYGEIPLHRLTKRLNAIAVGNTGRIALINDDGTILSISNLDADFLRHSSLAHLDRLENGFFSVDFLGKDALSAQVRVASNDWTVMVILPYEEFIAGPHQLRNQYLFILLGVAGCGALLAFLLATRITAPLLTLAAASRSVAGGRLEPIPPLRSRDEISQLVTSFNQMIFDLQTTTVSRDQLDNILRSMHDALFVVGSDGRVRLVNQACCELFELTRESVSGQPFDETFGKRLFHFDCFAVLQLFEEQKQFETLLRNSNDRQIAVAISISSLPEAENNAKGFICLIQDISERKASEEKIRNSRNFLETVLNSMGDAISIIDTESFIVVGTNQVFLERSGRTEAEVLGQKCYDLALHNCSVDKRTAQGCPMLATVASGAEADAEYEHLDMDGQRIYVGVKTSPIKNDKGEVATVVHVARDISERRRAEQELKTFAAKLEQSNRELTDFAYVASHDLQEPLRKVTAFGDRLKTKYQEVLGAQGLDYLERMCHAAVRMQTLIEDLLSFSRVTTKAQPFTRVDLGGITREVLGDLEIRVQDLHGTIEVGELPAIEADPLQIRQIIQNLIGNALKFHRPDIPPVIRVQGELIDAGKNCRITVADNGIGFEEQYLERIFGVFQRLHGRNEYAGSGVGLAICRKITDRHHGTITATSVTGAGSTFIVTLPVIQQEGETIHDQKG